MNSNKNNIFLGAMFFLSIIYLTFLINVSITNSNLEGFFYLYYEEKSKHGSKKYYDKNIYLVIKDESVIYCLNDKTYVGWKINKKNKTINNLQSIEYKYTYSKGILTFDKNSYVKKDSHIFCGLKISK